MNELRSETKGKSETEEKELLFEVTPFRISGTDRLM